MASDTPRRPWVISAAVAEEQVNAAMLSGTNLAARMCLDMASKMETGALPAMDAPSALRLIAGILHKAAAETAEERARR